MWTRNAVRAAFAAVLVGPVATLWFIVLLDVLLSGNGAELVSMLGLTAALMMFSLPIGLAIGLGVALPVFQLLDRRWPGRWWTAPVIGTVVALAFALLLGAKLWSSVPFLGAGLVGGLTFRAVLGRDDSTREKAP